MGVIGVILMIVGVMCYVIPLLDKDRLLLFIKPTWSGMKSHEKIWGIITIVCFAVGFVLIILGHTVSPAS